MKSTIHPAQYKERNTALSIFQDMIEEGYKPRLCFYLTVAIFDKRLEARSLARAYLVTKYDIQMEIYEGKIMGMIIPRIHRPGKKEKKHSAKVVQFPGGKS